MERYLTATFGSALLVGLIVGLLPSKASAVLLDITVTGTVDQVSGLHLAGQFNTAQTMSATITYDSNTPGSTGLPPVFETAYSPAVISGSYSIGGYAGTLGVGIISMQNDEPVEGDAFRLLAIAMGPMVGLDSPERFSLLFEDLTGAAIGNRLLPLTTADLAGFPDRRWGLAFGAVLGGGTVPGVSGTLTSLTISQNTNPVPLLPTWLLIGIGGVAGCRFVNPRARSS